METFISGSAGLGNHVFRFRRVIHVPEAGIKDPAREMIEQLSLGLVLSQPTIFDGVDVDQDGLGLKTKARNTGKYGLN